MTKPPDQDFMDVTVVPGQLVDDERPVAMTRVLSFGRHWLGVRGLDPQVYGDQLAAMLVERLPEGPYTEAWYEVAGRIVNECIQEMEESR